MPNNQYWKLYTPLAYKLSQAVLHNEAKLVHIFQRNNHTEHKLAPLKHTDACECLACEEFTEY